LCVVVVLHAVGGHPAHGRLHLRQASLSSGDSSYGRSAQGCLPCGRALPIPISGASKGADPLRASRGHCPCGWPIGKPQRMHHMRNGNQNKN
ncbi:hypothetical protein GW17_00050453, partial [Ensete ventricosum]